MSERIIQWGVLRPGDDWPAHLAVAGAGSLDEKDARRIARNHGTVAVCRELTYGDWAEPDPVRCGENVRGTVPSWAGSDQIDPCTCVRPKGHDDGCVCAHDAPEDMVSQPTDSERYRSAT